MLKRERMRAVDQFPAVCSLVRNSFWRDARSEVPNPNAGAVPRALRTCDPNMLFPSRIACAVSILAGRRVPQAQALTNPPLRSPKQEQPRTHNY